MNKAKTLKCEKCELEFHKLFDSKAIKSWCKIVKSSKNPDDVHDQLNKWLSEFKTHKNAGNMLCQLLRILPSKQMIPLAKDWIELYSDNRTVSELIVELISVDDSDENIDYAMKHLESVDLHNLYFIIEQSFKQGANKRIQAKLTELLHNNPEHEVWRHQFLISNERTPEGEKFLITWLNFNKDNPEIFVMPYSALPEKSPTVLHAVFNWLINGGKKSEDCALVTSYLLESMYKKEHPDLTELIEFARDLFKNNQNDKNAESLISSLVHVSRNADDIAIAKAWIKEERTDSQMIVASLIQCAPDEEVVECAKKLLRKLKAHERIPVLTGTLITACADEETIAWAKDSYKRNRLTWILQYLLNFAPDEEIIQLATEHVSSSNLEKQSPLFLYFLVKADPNNEIALDISKKWLAEYPDFAASERLAELMNEINQ